MEKSTAHKFDKVAKIYNTPIFQLYYLWAHRACINFLKDYLKDNFKILDIACGTGVFLEKIAKEKEGLQLFGIDNSQGMISVANQRHNTINFEVASAEKIPFENNFFDIVTIIDAFYYFQDKEKSLQECSRVLKPNQHLFIFYLAVDTFPKFILKLIRLESKLFFYNTEEYSTFPTMQEFKKMAERSDLQIVAGKIQKLHRFIALRKS